MRRSLQSMHIFMSRASRDRMIERSKMTLEQLENEEYLRNRERRRLDLINPNRSRTFKEIEEDGDLPRILGVTGIFAVFVFAVYFSDSTDNRDDNFSFGITDNEEDKD